MVIYDVTEVPELSKAGKVATIEVVVDRIVIKEGIRSRALIRLMSRIADGYVVIGYHGWQGATLFGTLCLSSLWFYCS